MTAHRTPPVGVRSGCVAVSVGGASLKPVGLSLQTDAIQEEHQLVRGVTVRDELFATDEDAYAEFERTVAEEGMRSFLDSGKVIPFLR